MPNVFSHFASVEGRRTVADKLTLFKRVIAKLEDIYDIRPFDAQSAQSLLELWLMVVTIRPRTVFELGCGMRSSTIALALAAAEVADCRVCGVDIAPIDFPSFASQHFPDLRFGPVVDTAVEATAFEIPDKWPRPILMLYDAHDGGVPGKIISLHAIANWFPKLICQTVAVHDCLLVPADFSVPAGGRYAKAMHWSGRCIAGFSEVRYLVEWMNRECIDFWRPGEALEQLGFAGNDSCLIGFNIPAAETGRK